MSERIELWDKNGLVCEMILPAPAPPEVKIPAIPPGFLLPPGATETQPFDVPIAARVFRRVSRASCVYSEVEA